MQTVTIQSILDRQIDQALGHVIYVVRAETLVFYVGQSKRDVVTRFWEHKQKPTRLGKLFELNQPASLRWVVDFYAMADCRPFVKQQSLFMMQAWEHFDMDMAEQAMIEQLRPVLNRDFNPQPTPLPASYQGQHLNAQPTVDIQSAPYRVWLNRMSLAGWVYEDDDHGRIIWRRRDGRTLTDAKMSSYREKNRIPYSVTRDP